MGAGKSCTRGLQQAEAIVRLAVVFMEELAPPLGRAASLASALNDEALKLAELTISAKMHPPTRVLSLFAAGLSWRELKPFLLLANHAPAPEARSFDPCA